ncbi:MAG: hypothetical protein HFE75_01455 [Firmicutes bacterium]|nr:hypothetical protein [Bacillota bacterium]
MLPEALILIVVANLRVEKSTGEDLPSHCSSNNKPTKNSEKSTSSIIFKAMKSLMRIFRAPVSILEYVLRDIFPPLPLDLPLESVMKAIQKRLGNNMDNTYEKELNKIINDSHQEANQDVIECASLIRKPANKKSS